MSGSLWIFRQRGRQPIKSRLMVETPLCLESFRGTEQSAVPTSFDRHGISRFVFRDKRFTKLIECSLFYFSASLIH